MILVEKFMDNLIEGLREECITRLIGTISQHDHRWWWLQLGHAQSVFSFSQLCLSELFHILIYFNEDEFPSTGLGEILRSVNRIFFGFIYRRIVGEHNTWRKFLTVRTVQCELLTELSITAEKTSLHSNRPFISGGATAFYTRRTTKSGDQKRIMS